MKVIKIIRESIKKNPRAGQETTVIQGAKDMTFEFEEVIFQDVSYAYKGEQKERF